MSTTRDTSPRSRFFQFRLQTLFVVILLAALGMGWTMDHRRISEQLQQAELQNEIYERQLAGLQKQLAVRVSGGRTVYFWDSADAFIEALKVSSDDNFLKMSSSLSTASDDVLQESVRRMLKLLNDDNERTRTRAVIALRFLRQSASERLEKDNDLVVARLVPMLEDTSTSVVGESIGALRSFGAAASAALPALNAIMADDMDWYAPSAAIAIAEIDPSAEVGPRLIELVKLRHPNWRHAASSLPRFVSAEVARQVLSDVYDKAETESDREATIRALNQIPP
jgi:hypothetical protein